jgi:hypothetical protein
VLAAHEELVRSLIEEQPDITLAELETRLAKKKVLVGKSTISRFLDHLELPFKKSLRAAEQDRPDGAAARKALRRRQALLNPRQLVFIDETSVSTTITRLYGRAPQGELLVQKVMHGNWKTFTFIAALRHNRVTAPFVCEGARSRALAIFASVVHRLTCQRTVGISSWLTAPSSWLPLGSGQSAPPH